MRGVAKRDPRAAAAYRRVYTKRQQYQSSGKAVNDSRIPADAIADWTVSQQIKRSVAKQDPRETATYRRVHTKNSSISRVTR